MGKILSVVLGLAVVAFVAWHYMKGNVEATELPTSAPKQQLDNVRKTADRIGEEAQQRADELMEKTR